MLSNADRQRVSYLLGVMDRPGLATGYPELVGKMDRLFADRIAKLPWVPASWLGAVRELQGKHPADLIILTPGRDAAGRRSAMAPSWADNDAKLDAWQDIYSAVSAAVVAYAKGQAEAGAAELAELQASAAFWDGAYKLAVVVRDLPANAVAAVGGGVADFVGTFLPDSLKQYARLITGALVLLLIGGAVLWYKGKLGNLAAAAGLKPAKAKPARAAKPPAAPAAGAA